MPLHVLLFSGLVIFALALRVYARRIGSLYALDAAAKTPACAVADGVDFTPTPRFYLLAQHFSAISAAGPIFGPIVAAIHFGWGPSYFWIVLGCVLIGTVHDFSTLVGSIRHGARSVSQLMRDYVGERAYLVFAAYIWLCLVYILIAFVDVTAQTFTARMAVTGAGGQTLFTVLGGGVATSSFLYLVLACILGLSLRLVPAHRQLPRYALMALAAAGVAVCITLGQNFPLSLPTLADLFASSHVPIAWKNPNSLWIVIILIYCGIASILPVWALLQPRGFLGGIFLYAILGLGVAGIFYGSLTGQLSNHAAFYAGFWSAKLGPLFPILFITIACGACSGFHGLVCSGTTSKQLKSECDAKLVGYGGMLLEGVIALVALIAFMSLTMRDAQSSPNDVFALGLGNILSLLGIGHKFAVAFAALAFATFVFDTIDVATRLARYLVQEITGLKGWRGSLSGTAATLILPAVVLSTTMLGPDGKILPAYLAIWPVFGTSNQLLAALSLVGLFSWIRERFPQTGLSWVVGAPMVFMLAITLSSLGLNLWLWGRAIVGGTRSLVDPVGISSLCLLVLAVGLLFLKIKKGKSTMKN